jgi:hypothetical protein
MDTIVLPERDEPISTRLKFYREHAVVPLKPATPEAPAFKAGGQSYLPSQFFPYVNSFEGFHIREKKADIRNYIGVAAIIAGTVLLAGGINYETQHPNQNNSFNLNGPGGTGADIVPIAGGLGVIAGSVLLWTGQPIDRKSYCERFNAKLMRKLDLASDEVE